MAPIRALAARLDDIQSATTLTLTPMGNFAQLNDCEALFQAGKPAFWEAYPETTYPKHKGFDRNLSYETADAEIPNWMKIDSGCWTPPVRFARINDAVLWLFDGIAMTSSGKLINESAFTLLERSPDLTAMTGTKRRRESTVFDRRTLQDAEVIEDAVLIAANGWSRAFGHWIYDTLTAIVTMIEPIRSGRLRVVLPEATAWQRNWLTLLGVPESSIIEAGYGFVKARHAIIPSTLSIQNVRYPGAQTVALINELRSLVQSQNQASPYLYLSRLGRGEASHRTMVNEESLVTSLQNLGFIAVAPETLTPAEQVALFSRARVILGPVGSAFALSGLAAPGASIVEILPPPAAHSWIYRSSANFDHRYGCIMAEVIRDSQRDLDSGGIQRADWFYSYQVDHDAVVRIAERAIELSR